MLQVAQKGDVAHATSLRPDEDRILRAAFGRFGGHALMSRALNGAPVITHDFHKPAARSQTDRDQEFWRAVRWRLSAARQHRAAESTGAR